MLRGLSNEQTALVTVVYWLGISPSRCPLLIESKDDDKRMVMMTGRVPPNDEVGQGSPEAIQIKMISGRSCFIHRIYHSIQGSTDHHVIIRLFPSWLLVAFYKRLFWKPCLLWLNHKKYPDDSMFLVLKHWESLALHTIDIQHFPPLISVEKNGRYINCTKLERIHAQSCRRRQLYYNRSQTGRGKKIVIIVI